MRVLASLKQWLLSIGHIGITDDRVFGPDR